MRRLLAAVAAAVALGTTIASPAVAGDQPQGALLGDVVHDCHEYVPAAVGVSRLTDDGRIVKLGVLVLLDRTRDLDRAKLVMKQAARAFTPLGIRLEPTFAFVELNGRDPDSLLKQGQRAARGFPLEGMDVVHVLTSVNLKRGSNAGVGGTAYCIGGVRYKSQLHSISISEGGFNTEYWLGDWPPSGIRVLTDGAALIAAHEIGHLLGAHHHYGNCAEGDAASRLASERVFSPCTVMDQTLVYASLRFGQLEAAVVRGHATQYASP